MIFLTCFLAGAALTAAMGSFAPSLGLALGVLDIPSGAEGHKQHTRATPAVGGIILAIVGACICLVSLPWSQPSDKIGQFIRLASLATVLFMMVMGFIDDQRHLKATWRLVAALVAFGILIGLVPELCLHHLAFPSIGLTIDMGGWGLPFTLLCLLVLKNAVNMADGRNGLILGLSIIWSIFFLAHAPLHMLPTLFGVLGCLLVLLVLNLRGRLFMGDCGSYGLATFFGISALALHNSAFGDVRTAEIVLLFLVPALDLARLIVVRIASGRSPMAPDHRHLHHLLDNILGWNRGWCVYMVLVAVPVTIYQVFPHRGVQIILLSAFSYLMCVWICNSVGQNRQSEELHQAN